MLPDEATRRDDATIAAMREKAEKKTRKKAEKKERKEKKRRRRDGGPEASGLSGPTEISGETTRMS